MAIDEEYAIFAGGCFWCMIKPFDQQPGIKAVISGYTGGHTENPTYEEVCSGTTGHTEAVKIIYDPSIITYQQLVEIYWMQTDPTDASGQFADRGSSYRPAIFYHNQQQKETAEQSKEALANSGKFTKPIVTEIVEESPFYEAETYHQDFYKKNPDHYNRYRSGSGRDQFIQSNWE